MILNIIKIIYIYIYIYIYFEEIANIHLKTYEFLAIIKKLNNNLKLMFFIFLYSAL